MSGTGDEPFSMLILFRGEIKCGESAADCCCWSCCMARAAGDGWTWRACPISTLTRCRSGEIRLAEESTPEEAAALAGSDLMRATVGVIGIVLGDELSWNEMGDVIV